MNGAPSPVTVRDRVRTIVDASWFQALIITLILVNALILGVETSPRVMAAHGDLLHRVDVAILAVFVLELLLRLFAHRGTFLRDPWSWFDVVIVSVALLPSSGPFSVLRVLRVLKVLRLLSVIPTLRHVVSGLFRAMPGMVSILFLVTLLLYVSAVMATQLFRDASPEYFGDLPTSLFSLFQVATGDSWSAIAHTVMEDKPLAWIFFVLFILVSTFVALNLFIAVAVEALEQDSGGRGGGDGGTAHASGADPDGGPAHGQELILAELRALRAEVADLRRDRDRERERERAGRG